MKKTLLIVLAVLVLGGSTYVLTQTDWLKGELQTREVTNPLPLDPGTVNQLDEVPAGTNPVVLTLNFEIKELSVSEKSTTAVVAGICTSDLTNYNATKGETPTTDLLFELYDSSATVLAAEKVDYKTVDGCSDYTFDYKTAIPTYGTYYAKVTIDSLGLFAETNEADNSLKEELTLGTPVEEPVTTYACTDLNIDPDTYTYTVEGEKAEMKINLTVEETSPTASIFRPFNAMADLFAFTYFPAKDTSSTPGTIEFPWSGTYVVTTNGSGTLSIPTGVTGTTIEVPVIYGKDLLVSYEGGKAGDVITAFIKEEPDCNDQLTFAAPVEEKKTEALTCTSLSISPSSYTLPSGDSTVDFDVSVNAESATPGTNDEWKGTVILESDNSYGSFNEEKVDVSGEHSDFSATYSNASGDTTIKAYVQGEENCSDTLYIKAEEVKEPAAEEPAAEEPAAEEPTAEEPAAEEPTDEYDYDAFTVKKADLCEEHFGDVKSSDWAYYYIRRMFCSNIVQGRIYNTSFVPTGNMTRAETIKVLMLLSGHSVEDAAGLSEGYSDVDSNDWFYSYYVLAYQEGIVHGTEAKPDDPITRGDFVTYMMRISGQKLYNWTEDDIPFSDLSKSDYYTYAFIIAYNTIVDDPDEGEIRLVEGYSNGTSGAKNYIARNEAMAVALRFYLAYYAE